MQRTKFDYSWFLAKNLAYAESPIMKFHYRNSSTLQSSQLSPLVFLPLWYYVVDVSWIEPTLIFYIFLGFQSNCVDVKSQRDQKSSNGNGRKSGKFSKCVPPWHNNRKQQMLSRRASAIGGFEQAKGTLQEVTQDESIRLLLMLMLGALVLVLSKLVR